MALTIGEAAKASGVSARTIRYYEQIGVLPPPGRTRAGYRQYPEQAVRQLAFVRRARALGLPLSQLRTLTIVLNGQVREAIRPRLLEVVRAHLSAVQRKIGDLQLLERELEQVLHRRPPPREGRAGGCRCLDLEDLER